LRVRQPGVTYGCKARNPFEGQGLAEVEPPGPGRVLFDPCGSSYSWGAQAETIEPSEK
jgi:hypothetical protein